MNEQAIGRRTFLAGAAALTASGALQAGEGRAQTPVPNSSGTEPAKVKAPANATDCHMHIYDPRFAEQGPGRAKPNNATVPGLPAPPEAHGNDARRRRDPAQLRDR
jgi:D-galactarolactone isomerase